MNNSKNSAIIGAVLDRMGRTMHLTILNMYPRLILSCLGVLFNILLFMSLIRLKQNMSYYKYLVVYSLSNIVFCLANILGSLVHTYRILDWSNSLLSMELSLYIEFPTITTFYFFNSAIDIVVLLDRMAYFSPSIKRMFNKSKMSAYQISLAVLVVSVVIDLPAFFIPVVGSTDLYLPGQNVSIYVTVDSEFAQTIVGKVLKALVILVRDILVMVVSLTLNIISIYMFQKFLHQKRSRRILPVMIYINYSDKQLVAESKGAQIHRNTERKAFLVAVLTSSLSILEHMLFVIASIYPYFAIDRVLIIVFNLFYIFGLFKRILNVIIFLFGNRQIMAACLGMFGLV